jgi:hypothetical protein
MDKYYGATCGGKLFIADTLPELADRIASYYSKTEYTCPMVTELQDCDYAGVRTLYPPESLDDLLLDAWDKYVGAITAKMTKEIWAKERA